MLRCKCYSSFEIGIIRTGLAGNLEELALGVVGLSFHLMFSTSE
jgi:hypothetical protein